jgi:hypothetical protein
VTGFVASRRGRAGLIAAAVARAEGFLLDPPRRGEPAPVLPETKPPVVAVVALAARCGTTTVARGVGAVLAARSPSGTALVCGPSGSVALAVASAPAARLAKAVAEQVDATPRVSGRLCLLDTDPRIARAQAQRRETPLIIDISHGADASEATTLADVIVLVAAGSTEPSLAAVVGASLARSGPDPLVVVSRPGDDGLWDERPALRLVDSRLGSRIALAGREPPGSFGGVLADLADRCEEAVR